MHKGLIIRKSPNALVPDAYWEKAVREFRSCLGVALVTKDDKGKPYMAVQQAMDAPTLEILNEVQKEHKEKAITFFLGQFPAGTSEANIQPFVIIGNDGPEDSILAEVAIFADGDFTSFQKPENFSSEYNCIHTALANILGKSYEDAPTLDDFFTEIQKEGGTIETTINAFVGNRGNVSVLGLNDKFVTFGQNELRRVFPWGWVSQYLGYAETAKSEEKPASSSTKKPLFGGKKTVASTQPVPQVPAKPAEKPQTETAPPPQKTQEQIEAEDDRQWGSPPSNIRKNNGPTKDWYRNNDASGVCPNDWRTYPKVRLKNLKSAPVLAAENETAMAAALQKAAEEKAEKGLVPVISADETKRVLDWTKDGKPKSIREKIGNKPLDPEAIMAMEKDVVLFDKHVGLPVDEIGRWDEATFFELGQKAGMKNLAKAAFTGWHYFMLNQVTAPAAQLGEALPAAPAQPQRTPPAEKPAEVAEPAGKKPLFKSKKAA